MPDLLPMIALAWLALAAARAVRRAFAPPQRVDLRALATPPPPQPEDYRRANLLLDHRRGCRCSTCALAAGLGAMIREQRT